MATLAKPQNKLAQKPQRYQQVGGSSAPTVKALNGIGKQISTNNTILSSIANALTRRRNVDHKIQKSLFDDIERRREALKRLNGQKKRPQLVARNLQRKRKPVGPVAQKKLTKEKEVDGGGGLGILNGIARFFQIVGGTIFKAFVTTAAFKWFSDPANARRFVDAFRNFYNWVLKPIGSFVINWTTWALDGIGSAAGGIGKIINGVKNGEVGELMTGFGDLLKGLPAIGSVAFLLNPVGSLKFIWSIISGIAGIKPPKEQGPDTPRGKAKPKPDAPAKPNWFQRQFDRAKKFGGSVVESTKKLGGEAVTGLRKIGSNFKSGLVRVGEGLKGIKDAAMRKLVEPAIEYVKPILNKLKGLKGAIEKRLMNVLGDKGRKLLQKFGGKGSSGLMKKIGSKAIPILGGIANLYFGYEALKAGDPIGALLEFSSGAFDLVGLIPGGQFGPVVSMGMDIYNFLRDMVPGIKDQESKVVKSLGLDPIMEQIKKFGSMLPGAETGRGPGFDAYDPRMRSGNFLVGALEAILNIMPGGEILKNEFAPQLFTAKRAFGSGIVALSETPMVAPAISAGTEVKDHLKKFFQATVSPIKTALGELLREWLGNLPTAAITTGSNLLRSAAPGVSSLLGLGDAESVTRSTGAPTLEAGRNYGIGEGNKFFFKDEKGQEFHAVNTGDGLQFFEGGVAGVGGRLRHTTNEDGSAANTGMVQAFLKAKGVDNKAGVVNNAGPLGSVGSPGEIYLHWSAGNKSTKSYAGKYHTAITGDGKIHRDASYSNRSRAHTAYRNSRGVGIAVSAMAGPNGGPYDWANPIQYESMAQEVADLAKAWGWTKSNITVKNVMTHAEAAAGKDGRLHLHTPPYRGAKKDPDNHGPTAWGGDGARWDLWHLQKNDPKGSGGDKIRAMIKQRMNQGGVVRRLNDGEDNLHRRIAGGEERKNLGGLVKIAETRGARVMGQSSGINRESILHPGITRAPVEIGAVQRVIMPIPTPMSAPSGGGGGSRPPSPLSTFGR